MTFKIHHLKLAMLAFLLISLFVSLGFWQLSRAQQKTAMLASYHERTAILPMNMKDLSLRTTNSNDLRFYRTSLHGRFDARATFLLDNKIRHGQVGYEVYTLFHADGIKQPFLVDRGFVLRGIDRKTLPAIETREEKTAITGMINVPPAYFALGEMLDYSDKKQGLTRVEYINLQELEKYLHFSLFPYIITLAQDDPSAFDIEWEIITMPPEKHRGYALQWFAFAFTLLILFVVVNSRAG